MQNRAGYSYLPTKDDRGNWHYDTRPLELQVIEVDTGIEFLRLPSRSNQVEAIPGSSRLLLPGGDMGKNWTEVIDAETMQSITHIPGYLVQTARLVNGEVVLLSISQNSYTTQVDVMDPATFEVRYHYLARGYYIDLR
jgi:hypothetical protein